jgi:SM-20-related protein
MVNTAMLSSAGLFVAHGFFPADLCADLREAAARGTLHPAGLFRGEEVFVDQRVRRAKGAVLTEALRSEVEQRLAAVMPDLGRRFDHVITEQQSPQLLVYERGAFFRAHQDNSREPTLPSEVKDRLVSAVVFLGRQTRLPESGCYCGGALTFFRLPGLPSAAGIRTEVWGEEGLMVAFPATGTMHEVRPVTHGLRYSLVTWFTGPTGRGIRVGADGSAATDGAARSVDAA